MKNWLVGSIIVAAVAVGVAFMWPAFSDAQQAQYRAPRASDGKPDLNGVWQALNAAYWDIEDHVARQGPVFSLGAAFSVPEGYGIVEGGELPYRPELLARKKRISSTGSRAIPKSNAICRAYPARHTCRIRFRSCRLRRMS
jgi:hypothetical protein